MEELHTSYYCWQGGSVAAEVGPVDPMLKCVLLLEGTGQQPEKS